MSGLVLVPAPKDPGVPARMRQPTKDAYRQWLAQANERIEQLQAEVAELCAGCGTSTTRPGLVDDLVTAATALGHHETLRSSSDETIDYWRTRVELLRAELTGENHG
ncbi:TPA: hypothetical protein UL920_004173 [Stenotrophomonas maltophilia]|nr:hypothetical protein [Stenotrophomonas maltophilia]HEL4860644.1 hypothetical protein [Stenotrophomonas maltophilia]HEL7632496.1 hypothetical protein [Stenotrophomonas maltophilia]HEL7636163.1 hypothetical protein [Stenotrophomonas maltophilia]